MTRQYVAGNVCGGSVIAIAVGLLAAAAPAYGQAAPSVSTTSPPNNASTSIESGQEGQTPSVSEIVVTGSRIARNGFSAPTPTTVVGAAAIQQRAASNIGDVLNEIPAFTPSRTASAPTNTATNSAAVLADLRGLGATRTLLLIDSQRVVPTTVTGQVDLNLIPQALIERVEVVTGGASAAYGSDAVAGVVNLILKKNLQGIEFNVQGGRTEAGDGKNYQVSFAGGNAFSEGRGHILFGGEYSRDKGTDDIYSRDWGSKEYATFANPCSATAVVSATCPTGPNGLAARLILPNIHNATLAAGGIILSGVARGTTFTPSGQPTPFVYGSLVGPTLMVGGQGYAETLTAGLLLSAPVERYTMLARTSYEFSDAFHAYVQAQYARSDAETNFGSPRTVTPTTIRIDNAYLPASLRAQMAAAGQTTFTLGRISFDLGYGRPVIQNDTFRGVVGFDGKLGGGWSWDAYYQYGHNHNNARAFNNEIVANYNLAADAVVSPTGQIVCRSTLTNPGNGCVPVNLFGAGSVSAAARAYINGFQQAVTNYNQNAAAATLRGEPFSTWAAPVSVALGGEYRDEQLVTRTDPISQANGFLFNNPKPVSGKVKIYEGFAETVIPLAKDLSFAKALDLNAAARRTHYSTSGSVTTYKLGLSYEPISDIRLRATRSRDIRAANLNELFSSLISSQTGIIDPTTNIQRIVTTYTGGNTALKPEKATTTTIGVIVQPSFFRNFQASVDFYNINIKDAIAALTPQQIVDRCAGGNASLCAQIARDATGTLTSITAQNLNFASIKTRGIDIEGSYNFDLGSITSALGGKVFIRGLATYVDKLSTNDGVITIDRAGDVGTGNAGAPHWRATANVTLAVGRLSIIGQERYIGPGKYNNTYVEGRDINDNSIPARFYTNLTVQYDILKQGNQKIQLFGVVNNLFDRDPPVDPSQGGLGFETNAVYYDVLGRAYRVGARFKF